MLKGQIYSAIGGLYHVNTEKGSYACRPRGIFRNKGIIPYVGDYVVIERSEERRGTITEINERKNALIRPAVANIDYMVLVVSTNDPEPNYIVIDKFLATLESHHIPSAIVISKPDLGDTDEITYIYNKAGYKTFIVNNNTGEGSGEVQDFLGENLCVFAGNTGTGKSSLLNRIAPEINAKVGETSKKLGRGRHTTRHVEIFPLENGLRIVDTPGFSTIDVLQTGNIEAQTLAHDFIDIRPFITSCKFSDCVHISEIGCEVLKAVKEDKISQQRYNSYAMIYNEIKDVKKWERP